MTMGPGVRRVGASEDGFGEHARHLGHRRGQQDPAHRLNDQDRTSATRGFRVVDLLHDDVERGSRALLVAAAASRAHAIPAAIATRDGKVDKAASELVHLDQECANAEPFCCSRRRVRSFVDGFTP